MRGVRGYPGPGIGGFQNLPVMLTPGMAVAVVVAKNDFSISEVS